MSGYKPYILICFIAACLLLSPLSASAGSSQIAGLANLSHTDYEASQAGSKIADGESFYQRYSLVAMKNGNIYNRRGGPYKLTLTYDHLKYLTDISGSEYSPSVSFFGWNGSLGLNMPHLYGLKLSLTSFSKEAELLVAAPLPDTSLSHGLVSGIDSLNTKHSDFTLSMGTNGGPYYYLYGYNHERQSDAAASEVYRRLGMGVQYGVNWIHAYRDEREPEGLKRLTLHLGNVALPNVGTDAGASEYGWGSGGTTQSVSYHLATFAPEYEPRRLWYRLTNWLDISVDFFYSDEENDDEDISTKRLTMALEGDLGRTAIGTYSTSERVDSDLQTTRLLRFPLWIDYRLSSATSIYFNNNYTNSETEDLSTLAVTRSRALVDKLTLISRPSKGLFMETGYALNKSDALSMDKESHSIYFDAYARGKGQFDYDLSYRYDTDKTSDAAYDDRSSYSHWLDGSVTYNLAQQTRLRLSQGYLSAYQRDDLSSERYERFDTSLDFNSIYSYGLRYNFEIRRSNLINEDGTEELHNRLGADFANKINRRLKVTIDLDYSNNQNDLDGINKESSNLTSRTRFEYKLERNFESVTKLQTYKADTNPGRSESRFEVGEELKYSYNSKGFSRRKLFDFIGAVWYKKSKTGDSRYDENWLEMKINYYPTHAFSCGAAYSSENANVGENTVKNIYLALRYPLLTLEGSYSQQLSELGGGDLKEDLYKIDFTKRF